MNGFTPGNFLEIKHEQPAHDADSIMRKPKSKSKKSFVKHLSSPLNIYTSIHYVTAQPILPWATLHTIWISKWTVAANCFGSALQSRLHPQTQTCSSDAQYQCGTETLIWNEMHSCASMFHNSGVRQVLQDFHCRKQQILQENSL